VLILCTLRLHREEPVQVTNVMAILWLHEKSSIKNTCLVSYLLSFEFFHKLYQVLEVIQLY